MEKVNTGNKNEMQLKLQSLDPKVSSSWKMVINNFKLSVNQSSDEMIRNQLEISSKIPLLQAKIFLATFSMFSKYS